MPFQYSEFYFDYSVDGDFMDWLNDKGKAPDNLELVDILPYGSAFETEPREPHSGTTAMRAACYFKKQMGP